MDSYKMAVLDIDGTLAPLDQPFDIRTQKYLRELRAAGLQVVLASGKNLSYIMGLQRGVGLPLYAGIGESGSTCYLTDEIGKITILAEKRPAVFDEMRSEITAACGDVWFQENQVNLAVLPQTRESYRQVVQIMQKYRSEEFMVLLHEDAVEAIPAGISKASALARLKAHYGLCSEEIVAAGNAENDAMLTREVGKFLIVGDDLKLPSCQRFANTHGMLEYLLGLIA